MTAAAADGDDDDDRHGDDDDDDCRGDDDNDSETITDLNYDRLVFCVISCDPTPKLMDFTQNYKLWK